MEAQTHERRHGTAHESGEYVSESVFSIDELDRLSTIEADLFPYLERMRTEWYQNGKVDQEWDAYLKELDRLGLQEWLTIKQTDMTET